MYKPDISFVRHEKHKYIWIVCFSNKIVRLRLGATIQKKLSLLQTVINRDSLLNVHTQHETNKLTKRVRKRAAAEGIVLRETNLPVQNGQLHDSLHRALKRAGTERHGIKRATQRPDIHTSIHYALPHAFEVTIHSRSRIIELRSAIRRTAMLLRVLLSLIASPHTHFHIGCVASVSNRLIQHGR